VKMWPRGLDPDGSIFRSDFDGAREEFWLNPANRIDFFLVNKGMN
jgi:hypothetical protein